MTRQLKHILVAVAVLCSVSLLRCASQMTPQGGPKDSLPPVVKLINPASGGRHFTAKRIFIEFDEYIQLKEQSSEFYTSPIMKTKPSLTIRGKGVRIDIKDTLLKDQTYSLNFGTSIRDNNEGNPLFGLRYVFSTGSAIDSMIMTGYTADASKGDSVSKTFIFFYDAAAFDSVMLPGTAPVFDSLAMDSLPTRDTLSIDTLIFKTSDRDSLSPETFERDTLLADTLAFDSLVVEPPGLDTLYTDSLSADSLPIPRVPRYYNTGEYDSLLFLGKPSAVGRAEGNGIFIAQNLKDISYRIYAIEDKNGNLEYNPGVDKVGFLDSLYNPATMSPITVWLDRYRQYPTADPQVYFRMFTEDGVLRHNLTSAERPGRHEAVLRFSAPFPRIDTLIFDSIPEERVFREYRTANRDTISLWFDMPPEALGDTIRGRISFMKTDSLGGLSPSSQDLKLAWRLVETREEQREREKEEKARAKAEEDGEEYIPPEKPNPFRFKVDAGAEVNPEKSIPIEFDLPLAQLDSTLISLEKVPDLGDPSPVPFHVVRDTMNIRKWVVTAEWDERSSYRLVVPAGVFTNIAGERNDSLGANFKIAERSKFATLNLNIVGKTPDAKYIVQIVDEGGRTLKVTENASTGKYTYNYLPEGEVRLRITEDINGNGKWDTGKLVARVQPERTEFFVGNSGDQFIPLKTGWDVDLDVYMAEIFAPISIEKIRLDLQRAEDAREAKYLEEKAKRDEERARQDRLGGGQGGGGGLGIGGALGGARNQIQSTVQ